MALGRADAVGQLPNKLSMHRMPYTDKHQRKLPIKLEKSSELTIGLFSIEIHHYLTMYLDFDATTLHHFEKMVWISRF